MKSSNERRTLCSVPVRSAYERKSSGQGWNYWREIWAAWCPNCEQETMPFPSGRCAFCDTHLEGQLTRGPYDHPLYLGARTVLSGAAKTKTITKAA